MSPTQRSLKLMRDHGYICAVVEKWNHHVKIRQDLFGFGDVLCFNAGEVIILQCCAGGDAAKRSAKIRANTSAVYWRLGTRKIFVHAWRKVGPRGKRKLWECREIDPFSVDPESKGVDANEIKKHVQTIHDAGGSA